MLVHQRVNHCYWSYVHQLNAISSTGAPQSDELSRAPAPPDCQLVVESVPSWCPMFRGALFRGGCRYGLHRSRCIHEIDKDAYKYSYECESIYIYIDVHALMHVYVYIYIIHVPLVIFLRFTSNCKHVEPSHNH